MTLSSKGQDTRLSSEQCRVQVPPGSPIYITQAMNRNPQFYRDKQLLAIHRERRELWRREPQYVELDPPIPRGWVRHWRLTARARNRHDAWVLETILQVIDHPHYHWRRNFTHGRRRRRTRRMIENTQFPNSVREHRWKRLGWPEPWKIFFRQILVNEGRSDQTYSYKFRRLDLLELFVERYYTYYVELIDPAQKAREARIETFLTRSGGDHRLTTLLDKGWRPGPDPRRKILARLANRRIRKAIEGDLEAEVSRFIRLLTSASDRPSEFITLM